jgi:hypothetical protein
LCFTLSYQWNYIVMCWNVTIDGFGLMTRFIVHFDTAYDYTSQLTIMHARTYSVQLKGSLLCTQKPSIQHYPETVQSSLHPCFEFFQINSLCISHLPLCIMSSLNHFNLITIIMLNEEFKLGSSSLHNLLQPPVTPSFLLQNILLRSMFSNTPNTLSLCSCIWVGD